MASEIVLLLRVTFHKWKGVYESSIYLFDTLLKVWKLATTLKAPIIWDMKDQRILTRQRKRIMVVRINFQASKCISPCDSANHNVIEI